MISLTKLCFCDIDSLLHNSSCEIYMYISLVVPIKIHREINNEEECTQKLMLMRMYMDISKKK